MSASPTLTRVLTAAVLVPVVLAIVFFLPIWVSAVVIAFVLAIAIHEFLVMSPVKIGVGYEVVTIGCSCLFVALQWRSTNRADIGGGVLISVFLIAVCGLVSKGSIPEKFTTSTRCGLSLLIVAIPASYLIALFDMRLFFRVSNGYQPGDVVVGPVARLPLLFTLLVVWFGDTAAYFIGRWVGRHKLAPEISPGKTWEGAIGNAAASLLIGFAFAQTLHLDLAAMLGAAVVASVAGQSGDLFESMYKRAAGVKDSGALLPGHGGVLDRIDALIFAAPAVWLFLTHVVR